MSEQTEEKAFKPPVRIWLQWYGEEEPDEFATEAPSEVTWCKDKIPKHDVEYILAEHQEEKLRAAFRAGRESRECSCGEESTGWTEWPCCNICGAIVGSAAL